MYWDERLLYQGCILDVIRYTSSSFSRKLKDGKNKLDDCLEIAYYLKGYDVTILDKKTFVNKQDTIKIAPPHNQTTEQAKKRSEQEYDIIDIAIVTPRSFSSKNLIIDVHDHPKIKELFLKIYNIWTEKHKNYFFDAMSVYYAILKEIYIIINRNEPQNTGHNKVYIATEYIQRHYNQKNFSCNILPELCGWKHAYFYKIFEREFKTTPQKYVTSMRMKLATDLLLGNCLTISEIADKCGYESVAYFSRVFKNHYGFPPTQYNSKR